MENSHQVFRVEDVDGNVKDALTSRFIGFPDRGGCGFRDEWQPKVLHAVNIHDMKAHYHDEFEEIFLVLEGYGTIYVGETRFMLKNGVLLGFPSERCIEPCQMKTKSSKSPSSSSNGAKHPQAWSSM